MFIDASAIIAILNREAGYEKLAECIEQATDGVKFSPIVRFEAVLGLARARSRGASARPMRERLAAASEAVELFVEQIAAEELVITTEVGQLAIEASMRFGKVVGHPADLSFGDCLVYASAKARSDVLLFVGADFTKTDLKAAVFA
jgi:ribonuclease VapC